MRHGHDIKCKDKVSGKFLYNLNTQYIQTLSKYDPKLYNTKIQAEITDDEIQIEKTVTTEVTISSLSVARSFSEPTSILKIRALSPPVLAFSNVEVAASDNTKQPFWLFNHAALDGAISLSASFL